MSPNQAKPNSVNDLAARLRHEATTRTSTDVHGHPHTDSDVLTENSGKAIKSNTSNSISLKPLPQEVQDDILKSIRLNGIADAADDKTFNRLKHLILQSRNQLNLLFDSSNGHPKIRKDAARRFSLLTKIPDEIAVMDASEIRCVLCKRIIHYPCWHWVKRYVVNQFHFFICFDPASPLTPTSKCYVKD